MEKLGLALPCLKATNSHPDAPTDLLKPPGLNLELPTNEMHQAPLEVATRCRNPHFDGKAKQHDDNPLGR